LPAGEPALAVGDDCGITGDDRDAVGRDHELLGADLCERGLDALPHRHRAGIDRDAARAAEARDTGLERTPAGPLHSVADADGEIAALGGCATTPFGEARVIDSLECDVQAARKVAAVERY